MNDTRSEDDLRAALHEISTDAPSISDVLPRPREATRRRRWLAPLAVAVIVAVVAVGIALTGHTRSPENSSEPFAGRLTGARWTLDRVGDRPVLAGAILFIARDGRLTHSYQSCFGVVARVVVTSSMIDFRTRHISYGTCPVSPAEDDADSAVPRVLSGRIAWSIVGGRLSISKPGQPTLHYVRQVDAQHRRVFTYHRVGVVVPGSWVKNATDCGTPVKDTVIYPAPTPSCAVRSRPYINRPHVSAIRFDPLGADPAFGTVGAKRIRIDGVRALELPTTSNAGSLAEPISVRLRMLNCEITISSWSAREVAKLKAGIFVVSR